MIDYDCKSLFGKVFPFYGRLEPSDRELLCLRTMSAEYKSGENIHGGDGECTGAILVREGCARAYMLSEDGREITLYRLYPGDICILSASCVLKSVTFDVFVDADCDSKCFIIHGKTFADICDRNVYAKNFALETAVTRFSDVMWVMQQILFMSLDKRLAVFLWDECVKTKSDTVKLTHEQIARYIGSAREAVSRMLKHFSSDGIVELSRGGIKVADKDKLRKLAL